MKQASPSGGNRGSTADPAGGRQRRGGRPPRRHLSPEQITEAAIAIADAEGLDAVSIRRIAAALDARPMSLYDHFESKDELLSTMLDKIIGEVIVPEPLPEQWRAALTRIALREYVTFVAHPWFVLLSGRQPRFGPNSTAIARQWVQAIADLPLEAEQRWMLIGTINDFVLGHSLRAAAAPRPDQLDELIPESDLAAAPELASLPEQLRSRASLGWFETGLETVLDGIERRFLGAG